MERIPEPQWLTIGPDQPGAEIREMWIEDQDGGEWYVLVAVYPGGMVDLLRAVHDEREREEPPWLLGAVVAEVSADA